jgi:uncharacterized protein YbcI
MPAPDESDTRAAGEGSQEARLNAALARAAVRIRQRHVGRGPAKATAFVHRHLVVVVMDELMTTAERSLLASGDGALVSDMRRDLDHAMELELTDAVERLTGCAVRALMSGWKFAPDIACQVFALDGPIQTL